MSKSVGQSKVRVDAYDKAAGRAKFTDDLCDSSALVTRIVHSAIAHGIVKSVDTLKAEQVPGVVKIFTCFQAPDHPFPTAGHPLVHRSPPPGYSGPAAAQPPCPLLRR